MALELFNYFEQNYSMFNEIILFFKINKCFCDSLDFNFLLYYRSVIADLVIHKSKMYLFVTHFSTETRLIDEYI